MESMGIELAYREYGLNAKHGSQRSCRNVKCSLTHLVCLATRAARLMPYGLGRKHALRVSCHTGWAESTACIDHAEKVAHAHCAFGLLGHAHRASHHDHAEPFADAHCALGKLGHAHCTSHHAGGESCFKKYNAPK